MSESPRTPRVLVVDDTEEMRKTIHRALSAGGYQVDVAATLAEAEAKEPGGYDAVLVDAQLGAERGIDLVERLRSKDQTAAARCVLISGGIPDRLPEGTAYLAKLAGGVAHDFNNLLAVISNYAAFVAEEVAKAPQEEWQTVREDIQEIERAAERAAGLTHQLLAFARRDVIQPRALSLNGVIEKVEQLLVRTLGEHVELSTDLAAGLGRVLADPGQLEQVLVNLAVNARDAMPAGGKLIVGTSSVNVDTDHAASRVGLDPGRYVSLKISDTGTGMPQDVIDRAFEPFFTTKGKGEGTGLGLATVYGIITQAGGYVQIYSEPGLGTTFTILLPETSQPAQKRPISPQPVQGGHGETVLVVEDEAAMLQVTRRLLARNGYQVITAVNGLDAIEVAAGHPGNIDVLLTDVIMPQMLGKEAASRICALHPGVKVLFMSGYTQGVLDTQGVLEAGVNLIEKPFTEASLLAKLREVLAIPVASAPG